MEGDRGQSAGRPGRPGAGGTEVGGVEIAMPFKLVPFTGDQDFDLSAQNAYIVGRAVTSDIPIFDPTISRPSDFRSSPPPPPRRAGPQHDRRHGEGPR